MGADPNVCDGIGNELFCCRHHVLFFEWHGLCDGIELWCTDNAAVRNTTDSEAECESFAQRHARGR